MAVTVSALRDEASYTAAVAILEKLWGAERGTQNGELVDVLLPLVSAYEAEHHPVEMPDPIEAIKIRMDDLGMSRDDVARLLSVGSGRVSEILNRRRRLTIDAIRILSSKLGLSEACLLQSYDLVPSPAARSTTSHHLVTRPRLRQKIYA